jgi:hypothetical protein
MTKRILVVEDQPDNRQIIRDMYARPYRLRNHGGRKRRAGADGNRKAAA